LNYGNGPSLFVENLIGKEGSIAWQDIDDKRVCITKTPEEIEKLSEKHLLCITGNWLDEIFIW